MIVKNSLSSADPLSSSELRRLFASGETGMLTLDVDGRILDTNPFLCGLLKYARPELKGKPLWELAALPTTDAGRHAVDRLHRHGSLCDTDLPLKRKDGLRLHFEFRRLGRLAGDAELIECQLQDLERSAPEGPDPRPQQRLLNHLQFEELANRELARTRRHGHSLSLLSIGIDRNNGTGLGGPLSAALTQSGFSAGCAGLLRDADAVGRVNDTTFVALLPGVAAKGALRVAERLRTAIAAMETPATRGRFRRITASIGVVCTRTGRISYRALRSRADAKRDDAKNSGGNRVNA